MATRRLLPTAPTYMPQASAATSNLASQGSRGGLVTKQAAALPPGAINFSGAPTMPERMDIRAQNGFRPFVTPATQPPGATMAEAPRQTATELFGGGPGAPSTPTAPPTLPPAYVKPAVTQAGAGHQVGDVLTGPMATAPKPTLSSLPSPTAAIAPPTLPPAYVKPPIMQTAGAASSTLGPPSVLSGSVNPTVAKSALQAYAKSLDDLAQPDATRALNVMQLMRANGGQ